MKEINRKKLGTFCLYIFMFLNPFGYDLLLFKLTQLVGSYWGAIHILYVLAFVFFCLFFYLCKVNPIRYIRESIHFWWKYFKTFFNK